MKAYEEKSHLSKQDIENNRWFPLMSECGRTNTKSEHVKKFIDGYKEFPHFYCKRCVARAKKLGLI